MLLNFVPKKFPLLRIIHYELIVFFLCSQRIFFGLPSRWLRASYDNDLAGPQATNEWRQRQPHLMLTADKEEMGRLASPFHYVNGENDEESVEVAVVAPSEGFTGILRSRFSVSRLPTLAQTCL